MGKRGKNSNYKNYPIDHIEDGLAVLGQLIMRIKCDLEKYSAYRSQLNDIIDQHMKLDDQTGEILESTPVPETVFHDINDKVMYRQMMMLKTLADDQKSSFSYKNLRPFLKRQGYLHSALPEEMSRILNDFLDIRNWSFHNAQSLFSASREVAENSISPELKSFVTINHQLNPVFIRIDDFYDVMYLLSLDVHMQKRIEQTERVLACMIKDYKEMYQSTNPGGYTLFNGELFDNTDVQFRIYRTQNPKGLLDASDMIAQISMAIQKSKYDGTKEVFDKWTCNRLKRSHANDEHS